VLPQKLKSLCLLLCFSNIFSTKMLHELDLSLSHTLTNTLTNTHTHTHTHTHTLSHTHTHTHILHELDLSSKAQGITTPLRRISIVGTILFHFYLSLSLSLSLSLWQTHSLPFIPFLLSHFCDRSLHFYYKFLFSLFSPFN
jgi:hypothetical protein